MNETGLNSPRRWVLKGLFSCACGLASLSPWPVLGGNEKSLVVYFSWGGNTRKAAELISKETGAELLEIKTVTPYPSGYAEVGEIAKKEWQEKARPKLAMAIPVDFADCKVIFLGYPVWNHTMPMPVYSFLGSYNFSGKIIVPFSTHMGDGLADGPEQIARLCPDAKVLPGLAISGNNLADCKEEIRSWLNSNNLL